MPWWLVALIQALILIWIIIPNKEARNKFSITTNLVKPEEEVSIDYAKNEIARIEKEMGENRGNYSGKMAFEHMDKLFYLESHLPVIGDKRNFEFERIYVKIQNLKGWSAIERRDQKNFKDVARDFIKLRDSGQNWFDFRRFDSEWHFNALGAYWLKNYPLTIPFAFLFYICLIMEMGLNLWVELIMPFQLIAACIFWPFSWLVYPTRNAAEQVIKAARWAGYALAFAISIIGASPCLAKQIKNGKTRKFDERSLQI